MKYFKRLLGLPFFLMLNVIGMVWVFFKLAYFWMKYGGEAVAYMKKNEPKMIADVYTELVKQHEE